MHCSLVCALSAVVLLLLLGCLQGVRGIECYKCHTKSSRRTDSCYLGIPTKGLERTVCKENGAVCIVDKRHVERQDDGKWVIETIRQCMARQDAAQQCSGLGVEAPPSSTADASAVANSTLRRTCSRCSTSLCNSGRDLLPGRPLRWLAMLHALLTVTVLL